MQRSILLAALISLSACGAGSPAAFPVDDPISGSIVKTAETLSIQTNNLDLSFPRDAQYDFGPFRGASNQASEVDYHILVASQTNATFSALLISPVDGEAVDLLIGRTAATEAHPTGQATLSGTFVSALISPNSDRPTDPISGNLTLSVDFDSMMLSGEITDRQIEFPNPFGPGGLLFNMLDIELAETEIQADGIFAGQAALRPFEDGQPFDSTGVYEGAFGGVDGREAVGRVRIDYMDPRSTFASGEVGVFAAGHE